MSTQFTGRIQKAFAKNGRHTMLMDDDNWYGHGYTPLPSGAVDGAMARFTYTMNGTYRNIDEGSIKIKPGSADAAPKSPESRGNSSGYRGKKSGGATDAKARAQYWEDKEARDIDTQKRISFQAAMNTAIAMVNGALANGLLSVGGAKKAQYDAYVEIVKEEAKVIFRSYQEVPDNMDEYMGAGESTPMENLPEDMECDQPPETVEKAEEEEWV